MKNNKNLTTISIGIPAYNEQANIKNLLTTLLGQKIANDKMLLEILVVSDGSTDSTVAIVKSFKNKTVRCIEGKKREGKNTRINQMFEMCKGDILILLDADVIIDDVTTIDTIATAFQKSQNIGLVAGNVQPLPAKTVFEEAFNNYVYALNFMKDRINKGNNVYSVRGPLLAYSKEFIKKLRIPLHVPDDRYTYFACFNHGFNFKYESAAKVWFRSPQTLSEQISQGIRFVTDRENLYRTVNSQTLTREYFIPFYLKVLGLLLQIVRNPLGYVCMKYIQFRIHTAENSKSSPIWNITSSTKKLTI